MSDKAIAVGLFLVIAGCIILAGLHSRFDKDCITTIGHGCITGKPIRVER